MVGNNRGVISLTTNIGMIMSGEDWKRLSESKKLQVYRSAPLGSTSLNRLIDQMQWSLDCVLVNENGGIFLVANQPYDHPEYGELDRLLLTKHESYAPLSEYEFLITLEAPQISFLSEEFQMGKERQDFTAIVGLLIHNNASKILVICVDGASVSVTIDASLIKAFLNELTLVDTPSNPTDCY